MPVPSKMSDLQTLAASNSPAGSDAIGNSLDDYIRSLSAIVRSTNAISSATIASASTTDLGTSDGEAVTVTGTATITSFGTTPAGIVREVTFSGACIITNSAAIALAGGANYTTAAGDILVFRSLGSGNWKQVTAAPQNYKGVNRAGDTMTGGLTVPGLTCTGGVLANQTYQSSTTTAALATTGAGSVVLRPNGSASTSGQLLVDSSGNASVATAMTVGTGVTSQSLSTYQGTVGTQIIWRNMGWSNGVARWREVIEPDAGYSLYRYDAVGGSPLRVFNINIGTGLVSAADFQSTSDVRLKSRVRELRRGLDALKKMLPREYVKYGSIAKTGEGKAELGFLAHEVQAVAPEATSEDLDGIKHVSGIQILAIVARAVLDLDERMTMAGI